MLDKGATITMEAWDDTLKPNQDWTHAVARRREHHPVFYRWCAAKSLSRYQ